MRDTNLVNALREHAEWARANEWETPITQAELDKSRAAGAEWNRRNGIKLKGRECDGKC
jgi:hypothetical protein